MTDIDDYDDVTPLQEEPDYDDEPDQIELHLRNYERHAGAAERLADRAYHFTYGDGGNPVAGGALATEAAARATLAAAAATMYAANQAADASRGSVALYPHHGQRWVVDGAIDGDTVAGRYLSQHEAMDAARRYWHHLNPDRPWPVQSSWTAQDPKAPVHELSMDGRRTGITVYAEGVGSNWPDSPL